MSRKTPTSHMRDSQTDTRHKGQVNAQAEPFQAGTIQEQSMGRGDKVNEPVGIRPLPRDRRFDSVGGRATTDSINARKIGTETKKK